MDPKQFDQISKLYPPADSFSRRAALAASGTAFAAGLTTAVAATAPRRRAPRPPKSRTRPTATLANPLFYRRFNPGPSPPRPMRRVTMW